VRKKNEVESQNIRVWPCRELYLPIKQLHIFKIYSSTRQLDTAMKFSWILFVTGVCANVYGGVTQQVLGSSLDLAGTSYTCENGMFTLANLLIRRSLHHELGVKPSVTCTDPLSGQPNCSCTCTNGITFHQTLPSTFETDSISCPSNDDCQAEKTQCLVHNDELKAQLAKQEREHLLREEQLQTDLKEHQPTFRYLGCYSDPNRNLFTRLITHFKYAMPKMCAGLCENYLYYGVAGDSCYCGWNFEIPERKLLDSQCEDKCPGFANYNCGGAKALSVYKRDENDA